MNAITVILFQTFREAVRNRLLYSIFGFVIFLLGLSSFFGSVTIGRRDEVVMDFGLFAISFGAALITVISGTNLLSKEIQRKTIYNVLSKPVERWQFVLGKFLGLWLTVSVLVACMGLVLVGFLGVIEHHFYQRLFAGFLFTMLEAGIVAALTVFFSCGVVTVTLAGLFSFAAYLAGRSIANLAFFFRGAQNAEANPVLSALQWIIPDLASLSIEDAIISGAALNVQMLGAAIIYSISYAAVLIILGILLFERRDFE